MTTPQRIGKYEIQAVIAKGSASTVCRGVDPATRREVALKFVNRAAANASAITRIQQQAAALARLRHPALAVFHEVIEAGPAFCIVSELIDGKSLAALQKGAKPDARRAWEIARQLLDALGAAHAKNVFHGDIRPANIFLDAQSRVRITDLGTWGLLNDAAALPLYAAPEHLGLGDIGARSDLYQAGVVIYEMVTGQLPFTGSRDEIVHRLMQERPADPSSHLGITCWQLDWVIQRVLSKDPADRFATAAEFLDALRKGLEEAIGDTLPTVPAPVMPVATAPVTPPAAAKRVAMQPAEKPVPVHEPARPVPPQAAPRVVAAAPNATPPKPALVAAAPKAIAPAVVKPIPASQAAAQLVTKAKAAAQAPAATAAVAGDRRIRILFVDDEERILAGLRSLFRQDYNVFVTDTPEDALDMVKRHDIQVIVSDQRMPTMTGVDLLREVKEQAPQVVRILLTGYSDLAALVGSINQGEIFRFVAKPVNARELRSHVGSALRRYATFKKIPALVGTLNAANVEAISA